MKLSEMEYLFYSLAAIEADMRNRDCTDPESDDWLDDYNFLDEEHQDVINQLEKINSRWEVKFHEWLGW